MAQWKFHATADAVAELLSGGGEFNTPERILLDLLPEQAYLVPPGSPNSIAQIVAHLANFLAGIGEIRRLAVEKADATSPDREDTSVPYDLAESALHNAYHLGQVVLLRRLQGFWPSAEGDPNDF